MSKLRAKCSILSAWIFEKRIYAFLEYRGMLHVMIRENACSGVSLAGAAISAEWGEEM